MPMTIPDNKTTDTTRVLSAWHQDEAFLDERGEPRALPIAGEQGSFWTLCQWYGGDVAATTMLKELVRVKAVEECGDGTVRVLQRYYRPVQFDPEWIANAGEVFNDLGNNVNHNLAAGGEQPSRFLGRATNTRVDPDALPAFREFVEQQGQEFLERVDEWLTRHQADAGSDSADGVRLGVGLFSIQD